MITPTAEFLVSAYPGRIWQLPGNAQENGIVWLDNLPAPTDIDTKFSAWQAQLAGLAIYRAAINAGLSIISTSTPALNGTYAVSQTAEFNIIALETSIAANQGFPGGASTFGYEDAVGTKHQMTTAQFTEFAAAIRDCVAALDGGLAAVMAGQTPTWPASSVTIA